MLDEKELTQVRDYVIKILPELLRSEPEIATTIEGKIRAKVAGGDAAVPVEGIEEAE